MKTKTTGLLVLLISILLVIAGCSSEPVLCADCIPFTFKQTFLKKFQDNDIFFIKGVASDVYKHGREIKVIEDLKGNFNGKTSIFVWGMSSTSFCDNKGRQDMRVDDIVQYHENDTLIMFIEKTRKSFDNDNEKPSDYATISCHPSILKLSNGYVTGGIYSGIETMSWEDLQILLTTSIQTTRIKNNIVYQYNGTIFFENSENKAIKLSFYDLSGKLVHEAITTSNSYRPVLTGNVFVCKININNKLQTIKYIVP